MFSICATFWRGRNDKDPSALILDLFRTVNCGSDNFIGVQYFHIWLIKYISGMFSTLAASHIHLVLSRFHPQVQEVLACCQMWFNQLLKKLFHTLIPPLLCIFNVCLIKSWKIGLFVFYQLRDNVFDLCRNPGKLTFSCNLPFVFDETSPTLYSRGTYCIYNKPLVWQQQLLLLLIYTKTFYTFW